METVETPLDPPLLGSADSGYIVNEWMILLFPVVQFDLMQGLVPIDQ